MANDEKCEISLGSHPKSDEPIASFTHDTTAWVSCAKACSDIIVRIGIASDFPLTVKLDVSHNYQDKV